MYEHNKKNSLPYPQNLITAVGVITLTGEKLDSMLRSGLFDKREQEVLRRYYDNNESYTVIGKSLGVSKQRIGQITGQCIDKLKKRLRMESLSARFLGKAV